MEADLSHVGSVLCPMVGVAGGSSTTLDALHAESLHIIETIINEDDSTQCSFHSDATELFPYVPSIPSVDACSWSPSVLCTCTSVSPWHCKISLLPAPQSSVGHSH